MIDPEFMKEFIRKSFHAGTLDLGGDRADLEGFVRIFQGEMESLIAIEHAHYLNVDEAKTLLTLACPTKQSVDEFRAWKHRILQTT